MGIEDRDWYRNPKGKHPPTCICADCTQSRLGKDYASRGHRDLRGQQSRQAQGAVEPSEASPFDPDHPGYYKGELDKKHGNIITRLIKALLGL